MMDHGRIARCLLKGESADSHTKKSNVFFPLAKEPPTALDQSAPSSSSFFFSVKEGLAPFRHLCVRVLSLSLVPNSVIVVNALSYDRFVMSNSFFFFVRSPLPFLSPLFLFFLTTKTSFCRSAPSRRSASAATPSRAARSATLTSTSTRPWTRLQVRNSLIKKGRERVREREKNETTLETRTQSTTKKLAFFSFLFQKKKNHK